MGQPRVETTAGVIESVVRDEVTQFLGVPYASPPLGARRFLPPLAAAPWCGVRRTDVSRSSPPQLPSPLPVFSVEQPPIDEDCLVSPADGR